VARYNGNGAPDLKPGFCRQLLDSHKEDASTKKPIDTIHTFMVFLLPCFLGW